MRTRILALLSLLLSFGCSSRTLPTVSPESQRPWREMRVGALAADRLPLEWPAEQEPLAAELDLGDAGAPDSLIEGLMTRQLAWPAQIAALLVYRPSCRVYERVPFVGSPQYRAQCTLEAVLLDTRSGVIPFATVVTRERVTQKQRGEFDLSETLRRGQMEAIVLALHEVGSRLGEALRQVPVAGN